MVPELLFVVDGGGSVVLLVFNALFGMMMRLSTLSGNAHYLLDTNSSAMHYRH